MTEFTELNLVGPLLRAIEKQGFNAPTAIQSAAIPELLEGGDLMGVAETGGGKTAAFCASLTTALATSTGFAQNLASQRQSYSRQPVSLLAKLVYASAFLHAA